MAKTSAPGGLRLAGSRRRTHPRVVSQAERDALRASYAAGPGRRPTQTENDAATARLLALLTTPLGNDAAHR